MKKLTAPRMERCIGCHCCALACSRLVHNHLSWQRAGIRIRSTGGLSSSFVAQRCLACEPQPCAAACPTGALSPRPGGGVVFRRRQCIRCGDCVAACPVEAIFQADDGQVAVCIHCGQCVDFCPHDCLEMADVQEVAI